MIAPESPTAANLTRLDYARAQLRDDTLTPGERRAAWSILRDIAVTAITDIANAEQDRADEALDAQRIHGGLTLDEFLNKSNL